jgi:hypothetical protein
MLMPPDLTDGSQPFRDMLDKLRFLEADAVIRFELDGLMPRAVNTGWTIK